MREGWKEKERETEGRQDGASRIRTEQTRRTRDDQGWRLLAG